MDKTEAMKEFEMMTLNEVAQAFKVKVQTIHSWIQKGQLRGIKINGDWRVLVSDFKKYVLEKLTRYARLVTVRASVFKKPVLDRYPNKEWYLHDEAFHGHVGRRKDYFKSPALRGKEDFVEVLYQKVEIKGEEFVVLQPKELAKIPPKELAHWYRFTLNR